MLKLIHFNQKTKKLNILALFKIKVLSVLRGGFFWGGGRLSNANLYFWGVGVLPIL